MKDQTKRVMSVWFDKKLYKKIHTIHMVNNMFYGNKEFTMSYIVENAIREYFENHSEEIRKLMNKYHDDGGCADL